MVGAVLVAVLAEKLFLDFDAAPLDQHELIALTRRTGRADIDLPRGIDGVLVPRRSELHPDIIGRNVLVALIACGKGYTTERGRYREVADTKSHLSPLSFLPFDDGFHALVHTRTIYILSG